MTTKVFREGLSFGGPLARRGRRLLLVVSCIVAASFAAALAAVASGLFCTTTTAQTGMFSAGTVSLTSDVSAACSYTNILPGSSPAPCTLKVTYSGLPAYLGLDVLIATEAQAPGVLALYNPSDATNDLQVAIADNQSSPVTYVQPSPATNFGPPLASCPSPYSSGGYTCYRLTDLLASTVPFTSSSNPDTFTTSVTLPATNGTGYQGGTASIVLLVHAVQSAHQTLGSCTAGGPCPSISWS